MTEPRKNRLELDDEPAFDEPLPAYVESPEEADRRRMRFRIFVYAGLATMLLLIAGGAVFWYYTMGPGAGVGEPGETALDRKLEGVDLDGLRDRFYFPEEKVSPDLDRAIGYYKTNYRHRARTEFENFLEKDAPDREKAIALTYLGVMALETDRFAQARHQLLRALKFNDGFVPALVNLSIAERKVGNYEEARQYAEKARELAPEDTRVIVLLGNILAENQDLAGAVDAYKEGVEKDPKDPDIFYNLALSLLRQQKYEEAILYFSKAIEVAGPGQTAVQSHAHLGHIYFSKGNNEMAADHLARAVKLAPDNGKYRYNLGVVYLRLKQPRQALSHFEQAFTAGSNDPAVLRGLSRAFDELGHTTLSIQSLEKALYLNPQDVTTLFLLGDLYYKERDLLKSADTFRRVVNITPGNRNTEEALLKLGTIYTELERFDQATRMLERARGLNPGNREILYRLGLVAARSGRPERAVAAFKQALAPGAAGSRSLPLERDDERKIRLALATLYRGQGGYDLALEQFRLILARANETPRTDDPETRLALAQTHLQLKNYSGSIDSFQKVVDSPRSTPQARKAAYTGLALAYAGTGRTADIDRARANATRAARMDPNDLEARLVQARVLMQTDSMVDRQKAIEVLMELVNSDGSPEFASRGYNLLGLAYYKNGEFSRALRAFDYAVQLDPSNREAYKNQRAAANAHERSLRQR